MTLLAPTTPFGYTERMRFTTTTAQYTPARAASFRAILVDTLGLDDVTAGIIAAYRPVLLTRKNRQTGTMVLLAVFDGDVSGADDGLPWRTFCIDHQNDIGHSTRADAQSWMSDPATWCVGCRVQKYGADAARDM